MAFRPYLAFAGNAREAFSRYQQIFGGELMVLDPSSAPPEAGPPPDGMTPDFVMHAALTTTGGELLMGADGPSESSNLNNVCVNVSLPDPDEVKRVFDGLAEGGTVQQPVIETFFSPAFGMCTDRFGIPWMVMVDQPMES
jgi:PhnB protein